jgi:hypothetical protein
MIFLKALGIVIHNYPFAISSNGNIIVDQSNTNCRGVCAGFEIKSACQSLGWRSSSETEAINIYIDLQMKGLEVIQGIRILE